MSLSFHDKSLPGAIVDSLISAIEESMGRAGTSALLRDATLLHWPQEPFADTWDKRIASYPLWASYYRHRLMYRRQIMPPASTTPINYQLLYPLRHALDQMYGVKGAAGIALRIGRLWWSDSAPINETWDARYQLQAWLTPAIRTAVRDAHWQLTRTRAWGTLPMASTTLLLRIALRAFAFALKQRLGILCLLDCAGDQIRLDFPDCPFCANHLEHCNLLLGVVKACVRWLYETPNLPFPIELSQGYQLHLQLVQADSHSIILHLVKRAER